MFFAVMFFAAAVVGFGVLLGRIAQLELRVRRLEGDESVPPAPRAKAVVIVADRPAAQAAPMPSLSRGPEPVPTREAPKDEPGPELARPAGRASIRSWDVGFENLFGRMLPIWAGGVTLAIAGLLIVKYSIDLGLLSPRVRVASGFLFGFALIGAAEFARRRETWVRDVRVRQALAGAGIATLYGSILVAANVYALVQPLPALIGMAAVTAMALFLALRFGAPSALLGLLGGLAAPALLGTGEPNIPLLSLYLALAVSGLYALSRAQRWLWLGVAALAGGFGWGALLLLGGALDSAAALSIGAYLMLLGVLLPALGLAGDHDRRLRIAGSLLAAVQMAGLVATGGFDLLHWGLFALISIGLLWLARRDEGLRLLPPVGLAIALLLLAAWPDPAARDFAVAFGAMGLIYGVPALVRLWRVDGSMIEAGQIAAIGLGVLLAALLHFHAPQKDAGFALLAFAAALLPGAAAATGYRHPERGSDARFALLASAAAILLAAAALFALPGWIEGPAVGAVALALLALGLVADDAKIERSAWGLALAGCAFLFVQTGSVDELRRAAGSVPPPGAATALLRWTLGGAIAAAFAWRGRLAAGRALAPGLAAWLFYCALAQLVPAVALPFLVSAAAVGLAWWVARRGVELRSAIAMLCLVVIAWALLPLWQWIAMGIEALSGDPMFVTDLPLPRSAAAYLLLPAALILAALPLFRPLVARELWSGFIAGLIILALAGAHIVFKQLFAIGDAQKFIHLGLAERTAWELFLAGAAAAFWQASTRRPALGTGALWLACIAAAHFAVFTLCLHNPLWTAQTVGALPLLNLLLLAYGMPFALLWLVRRHEPALLARLTRAFDIAAMVLVTLAAFSLLRQLFHGSILVDPGVSAPEDIMRSVLAIALAIGFLLWGIARGARDWRIASLLLMLAAVAKVFLFDAAGLEGLARILSFIALGFSLIGIGWLYSRYLNEDRMAAGSG